MFFGYVDYTFDSLPFYVGIGNEARVNNLRRVQRSNKHSFISKQFGQQRIVEFQTEVWSEACAWEKQTIWMLKTFHLESETVLGCNFSYGGDGGPLFTGRKHSEKTIQKMSKAKLGKRHSEFSKQKMSMSRVGSGNSFFGKKHSEETRVHLSKLASQRAGNLNSNSKLTLQDCVDIRELLKEQNVKEIAVTFDVHVATIRQIRDHKHWSSRIIND